MDQNANFQVGREVVFRQTTGECVTGRSFGVILAIGSQCQMMACSDLSCAHKREDGAVVAWQADGDSPACVTWRPFWNMRLSALPEPNQRAARSRRAR